MSCEHYKRNCSIYCSVCDRIYACHKCHDSQINDHLVDRRKVEKISCNICNTVQSIKSHCEKCNIQFAAEYCLKCAYFGDVITTHCDKCHLCFIQTFFSAHKDLCWGDADCAFCLEKLSE